MALTLSDHFCSCSVCAINNIQQQSAEDTIKQYIGKLAHTTFNENTKRYASGHRFGYYIHVFFSGPKFEGWERTRDHWFNEKGWSCDGLAAYIRAEKLGTVIETEGRWNHRHATREKGQGDVVCYVWTPDPDALAAWWEKHKEAKSAPA